ncbi:MAG: hypothetical protein HOH95_12865 [Dehalococcoidia bacterium]|jgi:hypothetical protein|nr:hypothetical protein [Dehalococcoidia bacterium]
MNESPESRDALGVTDITGLTEREDRWWQWHLGDRMVRHQHPDDTDFGCSWPACAWHGYRPGDDTFIDSLPGVAFQSIAATHLEELNLGGTGHFVYERDADLYEDDEDDLD